MLCDGMRPRCHDRGPVSTNRCLLPTTVPPTAVPPTAVPPTVVPFRVGFVTDTGGIADKSFNQTQWEGIHARRY